LAYATSCVLAATVVSHGIVLSTVEAPGPELPADADTNTPAAAACRNATSVALNSSMPLPTE
jgi:hypothetical protein